MARIIKSILSLLLIGVLHVAANNILVKENLYDGSADMPFSPCEYCFDNIKLPYLPDAELGSIGFYIQHNAHSRTSRTHFSGSAYSLRDIALLMAEREAMLIKHWQKVHDDYLFSITHPVSEYYIFALRHIII